MKLFTEWLKEKNLTEGLAVGQGNSPQRLVEMDESEPLSATSSEQAYMETRHAWTQVKQYIKNLETEQQNKKSTLYGTGRVNIPLAKRAIEEFEEKLIQAGLRIY